MDFSFGVTVNGREHDDETSVVAYATVDEVIAGAREHLLWILSWPMEVEAATVEVARGPPRAGLRSRAGSGQKTP